jgi:uncharacterized protein with HEPN domain
MPRSTEERLEDIRDAATDLRDYVESMETEAFHALSHADRMGFRSLKNALTELGEAVKALPAEVLQRHPKVDWKGFAGLRDMVTHQYFGLDTRRLLPIIRDEVPDLLAAVEAELSPGDPEDTPPGFSQP